MNANEANPKYELFRKATLELGGTQRQLKVNTDKTGKSAFESNPTPVQPQDLIQNSGGEKSLNKPSSNAGYIAEGIGKINSAKK